MITYIATIVLFVLALVGIFVRKTVFATPLPEQKRRAVNGSDRTKALYRIAAYDGSARVLFWSWISLATAGAFVLLTTFTPLWLSFVLVVLILWFGFSWLPANEGSSLGLSLTLLVAPAVSWLLNVLFHPLNASAKVVAKRYARPPHTGIYEREDVMSLLVRQQGQVDNRLSNEELEIVKRALDFGDHTVNDVLTPADKIFSIIADDTVGPVLINEIHTSGQPFVMVREKAKGPVLGMLPFDRLDLHSSGEVSKYMDTHLYFLHEKDSLSEALHAFYATNRSVFLVVNNAEEFVGLVTINDLLEQLMGHIPWDDFDEYTSAVAVAHRHTKPTKSKRADIDYEEVLE